MYDLQTIKTPTLRSRLDILNTFVDQAHGGAFGPKGNVLCLSSPRGRGNTTLLNAFVRQRKDRNISHEFILTHWSECSEESQSLSKAVTRWVGILGEVLGDEVTEWNNSTRLDLEHMVSGQPSEQYLMAKFNRFMKLAASGNQGSGASPKNNDGTNVQTKLILIIDGADCIVNHAGLPVLHWLPEILPEGCCVVLSSTLHEKMTVKPYDIDHPDRAFPREVANSNLEHIQQLIQSIRSLSQYESLSAHGSRVSPILREAMRRKYWLLTIPPLVFEDQVAIVRGTVLRRNTKIRLQLESVPKLRGILLEQPEDIEIREAMDELIKVCEGKVRAPNDADSYSSDEDEALDDDLDSDLENETWWNRKDVRRLKSTPAVLRLLIAIGTEAVPGTHMQSICTCLRALRTTSLNPYNQQACDETFHTLHKHVLSTYEETFEYASCLLDGDGLLIRPSTTTYDDYVNKDLQTISLFRFVVGTIGNSRYGCTRTELLGMVRLCKDTTVQLSSSMRSYCLWLVRDTLMSVHRKAPNVEDTHCNNNNKAKKKNTRQKKSKEQNRHKKKQKKTKQERKKKEKTSKTSNHSSGIFTSPMKRKNKKTNNNKERVLSPQQQTNYIAGRFLNSAGKQQHATGSKIINDDPRSWFAGTIGSLPSTPEHPEQSSRSANYSPGRFLTSAGSPQGGTTARDDPKLWFSTTSSPPCTPGYENDDASTSWDPRPMSRAQLRSLNLFAHFATAKTIAKNVKNDVQHSMSAQSYHTVPLHLRHDRRSETIESDGHTVVHPYHHDTFSYHTTTEMLVMPYSTHNLYLLLNYKDTKALRKFAVQYYTNQTTTNAIPRQRQIEELPWHYSVLKNWLELKNMLVNPETFNQFWVGMGGANRLDLVRWWLTVVKKSTKKKRRNSKKTKKNKRNKNEEEDDVHLFDVFDVVTEYITNIDHWAKMKNSNGASGGGGGGGGHSKSRSTKSRSTKSRGKHKTPLPPHHEHLNEQLLLHRVLTFFHFCSNISDDRLYKQTALIVPQFNRLLPPNVEHVVDLMNGLLPLPSTAAPPSPTLSPQTMKHSKTCPSRRGFQCSCNPIALSSSSTSSAPKITISSMLKATTPSISLRSIERMDRMTLPTSGPGQPTHAQRNYTNFNNIGLYWSTRYCWVQFPTFIKEIILEQVTSNKNVYKDIILHSQQQEEATRNEHGSGTSSKKSTHSPSKKTTQTLGTTPLRGGKKKKKNPNKSYSTTTSNLGKSAGTSAATISTLSVPVKIKLGDDPFDLLHTMMNKSSGSIDQKINNLREAIMKKKRQYNRCLVTRRALDKKTIGLKNIYHQCKETVKDTEAQLSKLRVGSGVATTTTTALTNVLENVLKEHRMKMYLTQITMVCNECTGLNTEKETTNTLKIQRLNEQIDKGMLTLSKIKQSNKNMVKVILPTYQLQLNKYQSLTALTLDELQVGANQLHALEQAKVRWSGNTLFIVVMFTLLTHVVNTFVFQKKELKRIQRLKHSIHTKATSVLKNQNQKKETLGFMKSLGLKMKKNDFKSGTRAMSYKNARNKLETIDIEDPLDLIELIQNQEITYPELKEQIYDLNQIKKKKMFLLDELKEELHGKVFSSWDDEEDDGDPLEWTGAAGKEGGKGGDYNLLGELNTDLPSTPNPSFTSRGTTPLTETTTKAKKKKSPNNTGSGKQRKLSKQERLETSIHKANKLNEKSKSKLLSNLQLMSSVKAGVLHVLKLLRMKELFVELENTSEEDDAVKILQKQQQQQVQHSKGNAISRNKKRMSMLNQRDTIADVMEHVLGTLEDKLGSMSDTANIMKKNQTQKQRRSSGIGSFVGKKSKFGKINSLMKSKPATTYWNRETDPKLKKVQEINTKKPKTTSSKKKNRTNKKEMAEADDEGPQYGMDGLVLPRRPVSRIISMRLVGYERGRMSEVQQSKWY